MEVSTVGNVFVGIILIMILLIILRITMLLVEYKKVIWQVIKEGLKEEDESNECEENDKR